LCKMQNNIVISGKYKFTVSYFMSKYLNMEMTIIFEVTRISDKHQVMETCIGGNYDQK